MTKIYEALEQAGQVRGNRTSGNKEEKESFSSNSKNGFGENFKRQLTLQRPSAHRVNIFLERPLDSLFQNIKALLPEKQCRIIQMTSVRLDDESTALYSYEFGRLCAWKYGKKVLLINLVKKTGSQYSPYEPHMGSKKNENDKEIVSSPLLALIKQVDDTALHVINLNDNNLGIQLDSDSEEINTFLVSLKNEFDFVIIDFPANLINPDFLILSNEVDGIVIVIEAEKTRWQVVEHLSNRIKDQGGRVLGVLLNKRKMYIPKILYKFL